MMMMMMLILVIAILYMAKTKTIFTMYAQYVTQTQMRPLILHIFIDAVFIYLFDLFKVVFWAVINFFVLWARNFLV